MPWRHFKTPPTVLGEYRFRKYEESLTIQVQLLGDEHCGVDIVARVPSEDAVSFRDVPNPCEWRVDHLELEMSEEIDHPLDRLVFLKHDDNACRRVQTHQITTTTTIRAHSYHPLDDKDGYINIRW